MRRRWRSLRRVLKKLDAKDWIVLVTLVTKIIDLVSKLI
jgi:hypothetical protein